jgi:hypothetical protein
VHLDTSSHASPSESDKQPSDKQPCFSIWMFALVVAQTAFEIPASEEAVPMQDLLDAWLACQDTWLYLEPIFSSPDIVKQMPEEGEKFADVDMSWREVMAAAALAPAALPLGRDRTALESLQACNALLDEIQKGLAAYLEKKRLFFPRYGYHLCACCRRKVYGRMLSLRL